MCIKLVKLKIGKEESIFEEIITNLNEINNLFDKETLFQISEGKLIKYLNLFNNEKSFLEELKKLKQFFEIEDKENDEMIEYLKYIFRKERIKNIVMSYQNTNEK